MARRPFGICIALFLLLFKIPLHMPAVPKAASAPAYEQIEQDAYSPAAFEALYFSVIGNVGGPETADFKTHSPEKQALFIALIFDMEIQCGGLAQFFWNDGSLYAALVPGSLRTLGLDEIATLYEAFLSENQITMEEIDTYRERFPDCVGLYDLHPFDTFDDAYMRLFEDTRFEKKLLRFAAENPNM